MTHLLIPLCFLLVLSACGGSSSGDNSNQTPNTDPELIDTDGDGITDLVDAFPNDPSEQKDSDNDGVGDNADAFPNDPSEKIDSDNDGVGDNADVFPNDPMRTHYIVELRVTGLNSSTLIELPFGNETITSNGNYKYLLEEVPAGTVTASNPADNKFCFVSPASIQNNTDAIISVVCQNRKLISDVINALPDANFAECLKEQLTETYADEVENISCNNRDIGSVVGVEKFVHLKNLDIGSNHLSSLDISANITLASLDVSHNALITLDTSSNTALTSLNAYWNQLTDLDLSSNSALTYLDLNTNDLINLNISDIAPMAYLDVSSNELTDLNTSSNTLLTHLDASYNQIIAIDTSSNTSLTYLDISNNELTMLDISTNSALSTLDTASNSLSLIDVSSNFALTSLTIDRNNIKAIDVSYNSELTYLDASVNDLTSLDISINNKIINLELSNNFLFNVPAGLINIINTEAKIQLLNNPLNDNAQKNLENTRLTYPNLSWSISDTDGDSIKDDIDPDIDNDGVQNSEDSFPFDRKDFQDSDSDGIGDNQDAFPFDGQRQNHTISGTVTDLDGSIYLALNGQMTRLSESGNFSFEVPQNFYRRMIASPPSQDHFCLIPTYDFNSDINNLTIHCNHKRVPTSEVIANLKDRNFAQCLTDTLKHSYSDEIRGIVCGDKQIESASGILNFVNLKYLVINDNQLTSIDVSKNPGLTLLGMSNNNLNTIDLSNNTALINLGLDNNNFTSIDITANPALKGLDVRFNKLTTLDVSKNTQIFRLRALNNLLVDAPLGLENINNTKAQIALSKNPFSHESQNYLEGLKSIYPRLTWSYQALEQ